ncbi:hypothetical protein F4779DRAFT_600596 [Xylariaceae sp. FL0662B]|nr:hypothetical protein F4779DRAFT_600596 [Xylariaceae sp. FL0662B]
MASRRPRKNDRNHRRGRSPQRGPRIDKFNKPFSFLDNQRTHGRPNTDSDSSSTSPDAPPYMNPNYKGRPENYDPNRGHRDYTRQKYAAQQSRNGPPIRHQQRQGNQFPNNHNGHNSQNSYDNYDSYDSYNGHNNNHGHKNNKNHNPFAPPAPAPGPAPRQYGENPFAATVPQPRIPTRPAAPLPPQFESRVRSDPDGDYPMCDCGNEVRCIRMCSSQLTETIISLEKAHVGILEDMNAVMQQMDMSHPEALRILQYWIWEFLRIHPESKLASLVGQG